MKKILLALFIFTSAVCSAQLPAISGVTNLNSRYQMIDVVAYHGLRAPKDTVAGSDSGSIFFKRDNFYYNFGGVGLKAGMKFNITSDWLPSDHLVLTDSVNVTNIHTANDGSCITLDPGTSVTITDVGGLQYIIGPSHFTDGNGVHHDYPATTITIPNGNAGTDSSRFSLLVLSSAGPTSIDGANSDAPVTPDYDPCTYYVLGTVLINGTDSEPATASTNTVVYRENLGTGGGEFNYGTGGTLTSNPNSTTNPSQGSKDISVTAMSQNAFISFTPSGALTLANYTTLNLKIRLNSIFNAATNLTVTLRNGATVSNPIQLTARGLVKTTTGVYQSISIPLSAFTGLTQFTSIRLTRNGTGGTVSYLLDDIYLQNLAVPVTTPQPSLRTVTSDAGAYTAPGANGIINFVGSGGLTTSITGNTLTIDGSALSSFYTSDGTLSSDRTVNGDNRSLTISEVSGFTAVTNSAQPNLSLIQMSSIAVALTSENVAGDSSSSISTGFNGTGLTSITTQVQGYGSNNILVYLDSTVLVGPGVLNLYLEGLPDGSGYDKVLAYNSTTGQVGYTTGGGGGGGSDSPDRINGTATAAVTSALGSNTLQIGYTNGSNVGNFTIHPSDNGLNFSATDGTGIKQIQANFDNNRILLSDYDGTDYSKLTLNGSGVELLASGSRNITINLGATGIFAYDADHSATYTDLSFIARKDAPAISSGTSAPASTPTKVGDIYVDTSAKKLYIATGTSSSSDWTITN